MTRRVVITSIGVISSLGFAPEEIMDSLKNERVAFTRPAFDRDVVICPVMDFDIRDMTGRFKNRRYLNRGAQFCVASAFEAIKKSGINRELLSKAGLFVGTGPNLDIGGEFPEVAGGQIDRKGLMALWILKFLPNSAASAIAGLAGIHGENLTVTTACSASLQAIGEAFRKIKHGYLDLAFAGGGDSRLSRGGILAYKKAQALFRGRGDPDKASRPFDKKRSGFVPGEGGAFFLLEELEHAKMRGGTILGEICGFGSSLDGYNMTAPSPDARWGMKAVLSAIKEAEVSPDEIDVLSAHGTSTFLNDDMEGALIKSIFGETPPFIIALKSWIGHLAAGCGAVELAISLACMHNNYLPPIRNLEEPADLINNPVTKGREYPAHTILVENFGFGGQNSALVLKRQPNRSRLQDS